MRCALRQTLLRWAAPLAALVVLAQAASATTVIIPADDDLIIGARAIVRGRVLAIACAFDDQQGRICTYITLRVNEVIKGRVASRRVVIKEPGGQVGSQGSVIFGTPQFRPGEEVLLYLDTWSDGSLRVHQMFLGKFIVSRDAATGRQLVTRERPDANVVVEEYAHADGSRGPATSRMELTAYTAMVRARLAANHERARAFERGHYANVTLLTEPPGYRRAASGGVHAEFNFITNPPVRWFEPDGGNPVAFNVNLDGAPPGAIDDVTAAMNAWSTVGGCSIRAVVGNTGNYCYARNTNTITFNNCDGQFAATSGCASILAIGGLNWDGGQTRVINGVTFYAANTGHVSFNPYAICDYDDHCKVQEIATHEMGHALGLGHSWTPCSGCPPPTPTQQEATMYGIAHFDGRCATLKQDDVNGILFLYPGTGGGPGPLTIITQTPLQLALLDRRYSQSLTATGGTPPYTWSLTAESGPLPPGLVFGPTGLIGGTPTSEGTYVFTMQVADAADATSQKDFAITVTRVSANLDSTFQSQEVPTHLDPGQGFVAVVRMLNSGSQAWDTSGLYLRSQNPTDNAAWGGNLVPILGSPVAPGEQLEARFIAFAPRTSNVYNFQWQLYQDGQGWFGQMTANVQITVGDGVPPLAITSAASAEAVQGQAFTLPLAATGGASPYAWAVTAGVLPPGLALNPASGLLAGTPAATGAATCTVTVSDAQSHKADQVMTITVLPAPLDLMTAQLAAGQQGASYSQQLAAAGGKPPYVWAIAAGALPAGLTLNATSGVISGTPTVAGAFNVTVAVTDADSRKVSKSFALAISAPQPQLTLQLAAPPDALMGRAFSYQPIVSGGRPPYTWTIASGALPAGLALNAGTGLISGTPTAAGSFVAAITVRDPDSRSAGGSLTIHVTDPATVPAISKVKYKSRKRKLIVFGDRFDRAAVLMVDGVQTAATVSEGAFTIKPLPLSFGPHEIKVINPGGVASAPYTLTVN